MNLPQPIEYPTKEYQSALYNVYTAIFEQQILGHNRIQLMTYLFAYRRWSWRVVGITESTVRAIMQNAYACPKGINRDHFIQNRNQTFQKMFPDSGVILQQDEWWKLFWKNDATILMTKIEHDEKDSRNIRCYPLNWKEGYFACKKLIGFDYRKSIEGAMLKSKVSLGEYLSKTSQPWSLETLANWEDVN